MTISRRHLLIGAAGAAAAAGLSVAIGRSVFEESGPRPPHLTQAEELVDLLSGASWDSGRNQYKSVSDDDDDGPTTVTWGRDSRVLAQCASFQTLVLQHAYGSGTTYGWATHEYFREHFFSSDGLAESGKRYPDAAEFRRGFARGRALPRFTAVRGPRELRPGDLVAIDYRDPDLSISGHIAMVRAAKGRLAAPADADLGHPVIGHLFEVVDCTDTPHGDPAHGHRALYEAYPDTRRGNSRGADAEADPGTGAGYGHMIFYADPEGGFAGYRWSVTDDSAYGARERPMSAARVSYALSTAPSAPSAPVWDRSV